MIFCMFHLRARNKVGVLLLLFALAPLPAAPRHVDTLKNHTLMGVKCEDGDWARQLAMTGLLLNPYYLIYTFLWFAIGVAMLLLLLEALVKGVFLLCTFSVHIATSPSGLHSNSVPR